MTAARILVVEDEPHVAQDIQLKLEDCGYRVIGVATSGTAALDAVSKLKPDLILMDIILEGERDGIETAQEIVTKYNIPIIYLTAHAEEDRLQRAKITEPFGYVLKPVHARELHAAILLALHKAEAVNQLRHVVWTNAALMGICDAVITLDCEGHISEINPAAASMFCQSQADAAGKTIDNLTKLAGRSDGITLGEIIAHVLASGEAFSCERDAILELTDGSSVPVHFSVSPINDPSMKSLGTICVIHNDSERRQAEQDLHDSEIKFRTLADNTNSPILLYRDKILYVNRAGVELSGYTQNELLAADLLNLIHPDHHGMIANALRTRLGGDNNKKHYRLKFITKAGTARWLDITTALIDINGEATGIATGYDITDQIRTETGFHTISKWVERLLTTTTDEAAFYRITCEGILDVVNADIGALPFLDDSGDQFTYRAAAGKHAEILVNKSMPVKGGGLCGWVAEHHQTLSVPDLFADARVLPDLARALEATTALVTPLQHEDTVIGGLSAFRHGQPFDAIDQELLTLFSQRVSLAFGNMRLLQLLEQRVTERTRDLVLINAELEAFSYSVSHDLRAPLRSINGFSKALREDYASILDEQGRDYLQRIGDSAVRMGLLIDDLLMLSQVSSLEMQLQQIDLSELANSAVKTLAEQTPDRKIEVSITTGLTALGDPRLMRIALTNLLSNAWKFTRNTVNARIEFSVERHDGQNVYFIRDNGAGFDMTYAGKLFRPFQRLHSDQEFEGTGIGLATVKRVIQRHNGNTWAEGSPGAGATIYFTL